MLKGLIGRSTSVGTLKDGLDASMRRTQTTAQRVANASTPGAGGFAGELDGTMAAGEAAGVDLEQEMVALADEQLRYDATARLLRKVYDQVRASVRGS